MALGRNRTQAALVRGEGSHHCAIPAPLKKWGRMKKWAGERKTSWVSDRKRDLPFFASDSARFLDLRESFENN